MRNLFADIPENRRDEFIETIFKSSTFYVERIVSRGHCSPAGFWYDQDDHEWVILLKGSAGLRFEGQDDLFVLNPGDHLHIGRHQRHRVEWTDPEQSTLWLAVHYRDPDT